jgi:hypothetical protein
MDLAAIALPYTQGHEFGVALHLFSVYVWDVRELS